MVKHVRGHNAPRRTTSEKQHDTMKVSIDSINSAGIRAEMKKDSYTTAEFFGSFAHPTREGNDWTIRLYRAADSLVIDTNGDPVWENQPGFDELLAEYEINLESATKE